MDPALELNCNVITTHIGRVPVEENETNKIMREVYHDLATILCDFLDSLNAYGVRVNFAPANLVMVSGDNSETAVKTLGKYIVYTRKGRYCAQENGSGY